MKKAFVWLLRIVCGLVGITAFLLIGGFILLHTDSFQNRLLKKADRFLTEKLNTVVEIDSVSVSLLTQKMQFYRVLVEDRQRRKMLQLEQLSVEFDIWPLLENEIRISDAHLKGLHAELHKDSTDSVANYQFVIEAFKTDKKEEKSEKEEKKGTGRKVVLSLRHLKVEQVDVTHNADSFSLATLDYSQGWHSKPKVKLQQLQARWERPNKKGQLITHHAVLGQVSYLLKDSVHLIDIEQLQYKSNNHLPRKNVGRPKRGFFDVGHFNVTANLKLAVDYAKKDSVHAMLTKLTARDTLMGIDIRDLHCEAAYNKRQIQFSDVVVRQVDTELRFSSGTLWLPDKEKGTPLTYQTSTIKGNATLKDISRTFAPVLGKFTAPLELSVRMNGNDQGMSFHDIVVNTPDKRLLVKATGNISGLKDKYKLRVHFDINSMTAKGSVKEHIINQFPVKKFMMKQLGALGTLHYTGSFNVLWKKEEFQGLLRTQVGNMKFYFAIDENSKYLSGTASTDSLELGKALDMPEIGKVVATANFKFDISKPRTAIMRKRRGGKLPMGEVHAEVSEAKYKFIKVHNLHADIVSDGAVAEGNIVVKGKRMDVLCAFSFTNTNDMKKTKIKPGIKFHGLDDDAKAAKAEKKQQKAEIRAARKQQKADEKAARKQQKEEEKQQKAAAKAVLKQQKAEEKAARKQQKEEEKRLKAEAKRKAKEEKQSQ